MEENYTITAMGKYLYNEKLLDFETEGMIIALSSKDPSIPTRIVYFGDYNPFRSTKN
jgi:hypothetical protein